MIFVCSDLVFCEKLQESKDVSFCVNQEIHGKRDIS